MTPNQQQEQEQQDLTSIKRNQKYVSILEKRIETITKSLSRAYFKDTLLKLAQRNPENAKDICNYIIAEKTEINIKISTIETRIKVIAWFSITLERLMSILLWVL
ncbi:MAG: hypothetical protein WCB31_07460 [Nitrososphaeraceae archaeon]